MTALGEPNAGRWLAGLLLCCGIYLVLLGPRDWIPHDDGALAHAAERILQGEMPHRDFNEPYTGGLSYLHALAFELFGTSLISLRVMLGLFALAFLAAFYRIALRFGPPSVAALATLLAFTWSLPNYFVPLPSWYNLFFATFGTLALTRYARDRRTRWLVVVGFVGGLSVLCKIVGLYYFAAVLLVLVYLEVTSGSDEVLEESGRSFRLFVVAGLSAFVLVVITLVSHRLTLLSTLLFIVPSLSMAAWLAWRECREPSRGSIGSLVGQCAVVLGSGFAVLFAYAALFIATSSFDALWDGTVSVVLRRLDYTGAPLPGIATVAYALPFAGLMVAMFGRAKRSEPWPWVAVLVVAGAMLVGFGSRGAVYQGVWFAVRPLVPILAIAAVVRLRGMPASPMRSDLFIVGAMTSLLSLVQFPFSGGVYFCYVAPFVVLLGLAVVQTSEFAPRRTIAGVVTTLAAFAALWFHTGSTYLLGERYQFIDADHAIGLPRGGIRVRERDALFYRELVDRIERHTQEGDAIYASPDMPEVYFLAARDNPTRSFFDSTDADYLDEAARDARIIEELRRADVAFAVLGRASEFSRAPGAALQDFLATHLPHEERMAGHLLRWREAR